MPVQPNVSAYQQVTFSFPGPLEVQTGTFVWTSPFQSAEIVSVQATSGRNSPAASDDVIFDVNYYDPNVATPSWSTIFTTQANRPTVPVGEMIGDVAVPDITAIETGMCLSVDVDQTGGGATPTDEDFNVLVLMRVT